MKSFLVPLACFFTMSMGGIAGVESPDPPAIRLADKIPGKYGVDFARTKRMTEEANGCLMVVIEKTTDASLVFALADTNKTVTLEGLQKVRLVVISVTANPSVFAVDYKDAEGEILFKSFLHLELLLR